MKKVVIFLFLLIISFIGMAQENFVLPVSEKTVGTHILYRPNDYIDNELNEFALIIGGKENSTVIAPVNGSITCFNYVYYKNLSNSLMFGETPTSSYKTDCELILQHNPSSNYDPKYISVTIGIKTNDGKIVYISGIRPSKVFKTGEKVRQGEQLGNMGYFYYKINQPAISIGMSKNGKSEDPMLPFGLKSTFRKGVKKEVKSLTQAEALEDLQIFVDALEEGYPGLYDYMSQNEWDEIKKNANKQISNPISYYDFFTLLQMYIVNPIKDNHLSINTQLPIGEFEKNRKLPSVAFGFLNDSLIITRTLLTYSEYMGKKIREVNGISSDSIKKLILQRIPNIDGFNQSTIDNNLLIWTWNLFDKATSNPKSEYFITFNDGTTTFFSYTKKDATIAKQKSCIPYNANWWNFFSHNTDSLTFQKMNDSVAFLGIYSFFLTDIEVDKIASFIKNIQNDSFKHLIIDVRNNRGGDDKICAKIFSFLAKKPFLMNEYAQINKKSNYAFFRHCTNYTDEISNLFDEYEKEPAKKGYVFINHDTVYPDNDISFRGNLYVITNERSYSAATVFAALTHKYKRGIIIGRETGSVYHQLNATKFAQLLLPNSQIEISIPLVKSVFDTQYNTIPFGRGVLPSYLVNLSIEELGYLNGDTMLNYTLQFIENGFYALEEEHNLQKPGTITKVVVYILSLLGICVVILVLIILTKRKNG